VIGAGLRNETLAFCSPYGGNCGNCRVIISLTQIVYMYYVVGAVCSAMFECPPPADDIDAVWVRIYSKVFLCSHAKAVYELYEESTGTRSPPLDSIPVENLHVKERAFFGR